MTRFRINIIVRIILSLAFGSTAIYFGFYTPFWLLSGWMILFFVLIILSLIRFVERSDRDLTNFLLAIQQNDFTNTYPQVGHKSKRLYQAFNVITAEFIRIRNEKEANFRFLKTVVEHSGVPLIAYDTQDETITLINQSVKDLFHIPFFTKLSSLSRVDPELVRAAKELNTNEKVLIKVHIRAELVYLSVIARELILGGKRHKVIAFHDINSELDQKEVESWQKLIRVMTHEIKNSVIPISTLAEVINDMCLDKKGGSGISHLSEEDQEDLLVSLKTIEKRSKGLVKFVSNYGDLARVPKPDFQKVDLVELIQNVVSLEDKQLKKQNISIATHYPKGEVWLSLDTEMIDQVIINLMKNAIEVLKESATDNPVVDVSLNKYAGEVILTVTDNGPGIDQETIDQVFIPFFTTKKEGSGIGLSYSKQVMKAHKGNIRVKSRLGEGTTFELIFRN
ncbi:MAG: ATP-binding protein [Marinoscillum sp.]